MSVMIDKRNERNAEINEVSLVGLDYERAVGFMLALPFVVGIWTTAVMIALTVLL